MSDVPPVTTTPAVAASWKPARPSSRAMSVKISSTRGWMISESTWRESWRGLRPPTDGTSTVSSADTSAVSAHPYRFLMSSASAIGVRRPMAMSFEMWSPPSGRTAVCQIAPLRRSATSVVPPPRSTTTIPSSFSSSYRTASAEASGSRITSWTARPARFTDRTTFWTEVTAAVDAADVPARDARADTGDLDTRHLLGLGDGGLDRLYRGVDMDDDPAPEAARGRGAHTDDVETVRDRLGDHRADLRRPHVQPNDQVLRLRAPHYERPRRRMT